MKKNKKAPLSNYEAEHITVLEGLAPVRKRPGMYIGTTGLEGLHHLIWEVVDNAIDEAMAGYARKIQLTLLKQNKIEIWDNGRGIPVDIHPQTKTSALEIVMTKLHAGGKFGQGGYKVSGGLHGVGISVVNALSSHCQAIVRRNGKNYIQEYKRGDPLYKVRPITSLKNTISARSSHFLNLPSGTLIAFEADSQVFPKIEFSWEIILNHLRQQAYLTKGIMITVIDQREDIENRYQFYFEGGIASYVRHLNENKEIKQETIFYIDKELEETKIEIALQYTEEYKETVFAFTNNILNLEGGTHLIGFRTALTRSLNQYARAQNYLKEKDENLSGEDTKEGLVAVISVKVKEPQFEGQTKAKLGNPEVRQIVETIFGESFITFLETHPKEAQSITTKCILANQARKAAKAARESVLRKGALEGLTLPGKLADCTSRDPKKSELFIVEGDSAGGSTKQGRNREFQAILPLRGKILNVERKRLDKMLSNNEIKSLIIALGTNIGEQFDIKELRYDRIIIMSDADIDGAHIRTLLLTLFYRYFPQLIYQNHLYIAQPPLYRLSSGKEIKYAYNEQEKENIFKTLSAQAKNISLQHYKGLGEMNPEQLWETTMDPQRRIMKLVTIEEAERADEIFDILMGQEVAPRKHFIQTHARSVKNLDI